MGFNGLWIFVIETQRNYWAQLSVYDTNDSSCFAQDVGKVSFKCCIFCIPSFTCRKKGIIVNIASIANTHPLPLIAVYSSTKVGQLDMH